MVKIEKLVLVKKATKEIEHLRYTLEFKTLCIGSFFAGVLVKHANDLLTPLARIDRCIVPELFDHVDIFYNSYISGRLDQRALWIHLCQPRDRNVFVSPSDRGAARNYLFHITKIWF